MNEQLEQSQQRLEAAKNHLAESFAKIEAYIEATKNRSVAENEVNQSEVHKQVATVLEELNNSIKSIEEILSN